jgi:hypothetical protein
LDKAVIILSGNFFRAKHISMWLIDKHSTWAGRILVVMLFIANSGFTAILHQCTMDTAECCDASRTSDHHACQDEDSVPAPITGPSVTSAFECHINSVAGGLSVAPAVTEKNAINQVSKLDVVALVGYLDVATLAQSISSTLLHAFSTNASPPSVEKNILTATLLI